MRFTAPPDACCDEAEAGERDHHATRRHAARPRPHVHVAVNGTSRRRPCRGQSCLEVRWPPDVFALASLVLDHTEAPDASRDRGRDVRRGDRTSPAEPFESEASLLQKYGTWVTACRAAHAALPDGRAMRASAGERARAHAVNAPGRAHREIQSRGDPRGDQALSRDPGRPPSSTAYIASLCAQRAAARIHGPQPRRGAEAEPPRLPTFNTIVARFSGTAGIGTREKWRLAVATALAPGSYT